MTGRRRFTLAGLALASGVAGCASPARVAGPSTPPPEPTVRVGDRWRYRLLNLYNGLPLADVEMRVASVSPLIRVTVSDSRDRNSPDETYARPWDVIQEPVWDLPQTFETPCPLLPRPLAPGAREDWQGVYRVPGDTWRHRWSVRVEAICWERVTVPAGSFEALRVTRRIAFTHQDLMRAGSTRTETLWYAPRVNRWVRREINGTHVIPGRPPTRRNEDWVAWELVEYAPATG